LIEFDEDQPFSLLEETTDDVTDNSIHTKLVLLVKSFPTLKLFVFFLFSHIFLRIIWARSPYVTIDYFEELKKNQDDPDTSTVNVLTTNEEDETSEQAIVRL
jgi:ERCC4-type nuclease